MQPIYFDDVIKWKRFLCYWPFMRGSHRPLVNSPHKGQWRKALMSSFDLRLNKRLSKQLWRRWFESPPCSLWRHCYVRKPLVDMSFVNCCLSERKMQLRKHQSFPKFAQNLHLALVLRKKDSHANNRKYMRSNKWSESDCSINSILLNCEFTYVLSWF